MIKKKTENEKEKELSNVTLALNILKGKIDLFMV